MKSKLYVALALFIVLGLMTFMLPQSAQAQQPTQPFKGKTVRIAATDALAAIAAQNDLLGGLYRKQSGVNLIVDILPFNDLNAKLTTMCQAGSDQYDAMWIDGPWYGAMQQAGCLEDMGALIKSNPASLKELALDDFPIRTIAYQAIYNSKLYVIPQFHAVGMMSYRTDLFNDPKEQAAYKAKYNADLKVPETWQDYLQVGQFFTRPAQQLWGFNHRYGSGNNIIADLLIGFAFSRGATLFDHSYNPTFNTPAFKEAASFFLCKDMLAAQPPGSESFSFSEVSQNMMQGKVAMYVTENWAIPNLKDPKLSPTAAKVDFAQVPGWKDPATGKISRGTMVGAGGYSLNAKGKNKEAAMDYLLFLLGKTNAFLVSDQQGWAIRTSTYTDPVLVAKYPYFATNLQQVKVSIARPSEPWWAEVEFTVGKELQEALLGHQTIDQAMSNADGKSKEILTKAGYYQTPHVYMTPAEKEADACTVLKSLGVTHPECK